MNTENNKNLSRAAILKEHNKKYIEERYKKEIVSYPPRWLTVTISNICNNKCVFCAYHSEDAKEQSKVYNIPFRLKFEDFKRIIDMAYNDYIPHVHICATGEPFMNRDILKMIDYLISVYGNASVQTNFFKTVFNKYNYLDEIVKRKENISYITTDILSGDPEQHNQLKKGSNYHDVMDSLEYLSQNTDIPIKIHLILTTINYKSIPDLIKDIKKRKIKGSLEIVNLYAYDFNEFSSSEVVYTSQHTDITKTLEEAAIQAKQSGVKISIPQPADKQNSGCGVFWDKIQLWPVKGNIETKYAENLIPHACSAVVKGNLNSLGYIFDYKNVMDFWNNEKIVNIRKNLINGKYPDKECKTCYSFDKCSDIKKTKELWQNSAHKNLEEFKISKEYLELNENSICIDCGANIGLISQAFAEKGALVYAFEPNPCAFQILESKFKTNPKIKLYKNAVSNKNDTLKLYMYKYNCEDEVFWSQGASVYCSKDDVNKCDFVEVEAIDLCEFIKKINKPIDILKLDIEGAEYDILLKLIEEELYKKIKYILVETHDRHIPEIIEKGNKVKKLINEKSINNINLGWV